MQNYRNFRLNGTTLALVIFRYIARYIALFTHIGKIPYLKFRARHKRWDDETVETLHVGNTIGCLTAVRYTGVFRSVTPGTGA